MNILDFIERFPGEQECLSYFIETRQKAGILCPKCGCTKHIWLANSDRFECENCGSQIGLKSGTLMENSKLSIKYWFFAIHLLTSATEKYTISDIQEKLSGAESEQVREMLERLNSCLDKFKNGQFFEQLFLVCLVNQDQIPESKTDKQNNLISNEPSLNQQTTYIQIKLKP